jgi:hypothetical protein
MRCAAKRGVASLVALSLILGSPVVLCGCESDEDLKALSDQTLRQESEEAIRAALDKELTRMQTIDSAAIEDIAAGLDDTALQSLDTYQSTATELTEHIFRHFTYEIGDITVDDGTAKVDVSLTNVDVTAVLDEAHDVLVSGEGSQRLKAAYDTGDENTIMRTAMEVIYEMLDNSEDLKTVEVTVGLERDIQNRWSVVTADLEKLQLAALGGLSPDLLE